MYRPSNAELAILQLLWDRGPSTCRDLHEVIGPRRDVGYTTVLKTLQIMAEKGAVTRDSSRRPHLFTAAVQQSDIEGGMVSRMVQSVFGGSLSNMLARALDDRPTSQEELAELRALLDRVESGEKQ